MPARPLAAWSIILTLHPRRVVRKNADWLVSTRWGVIRREKVGRSRGVILEAGCATRRAWEVWRSYSRERRASQQPEERSQHAIGGRTSYVLPPNCTIPDLQSHNHAPAAPLACKRSMHHAYCADYRPHARVSHPRGQSRHLHVCPTLTFKNFACS
jgi:hypothetical protein